ncbi:4-alpha-glucanotransferase [Sphingobium sp. CR2-8]|uniref:4-alpha-glucanotransferase n=1 Tax=Sphingobium sp. CR2-8 TaxID=1306534 RepID=UPI002DBFA9BB|nr:4-alpha-glucanotransferase [Sphingobium sp. CR2-8]MEC3909195.1 4-alpha-glucanotransferase [Sphingobium sp. CR2-8]
MNALHALAGKAGLARSWTDANGETQDVSDESLRAILTALGLPATDPDMIAHSMQALRDRESRGPAMVTADIGQPLPLTPDLIHGRLFDDADAQIDLSLDQLRQSGIAHPGYYRLETGNRQTHIAIAPNRCPAIPGRCWGLSVQIPSLRGRGEFGDFGTLAEAVYAMAAIGADAVAISPIHSLADPERFTPYSPSSRLSLNSLFAEAEAPPPDGNADLIDWTKAGPAKIEALRRIFAEQGSGESFDAFAQSHARQGLDKVQRAARESGMAIGLITDLAVGVDPSGADVSCDPQAFLQGLGIGAPPDPLGPDGQNWGLTSYHPHALIDRGFAPFIALLRANIPEHGGIRIDHGFGLERLWVIPAGKPASAGAYLSFPFDDMLRLVKLEAWRAHAIVIAEDLGTRPPGFGDALEKAGIYGMAVLPFQRDDAGAFLPAADYSGTAVAMSATHDTPTLAGWWTGRDLAWVRLLDRGDADEAERALEREALWRVIGGTDPMPPPDDPAPVIDRALAFLAGSNAPLLIVPMEDLVGLTEQPNLPGTIDEHPNWRRRLPAPIRTLLARDDVTRRIDQLNKERGR